MAAIVEWSINAKHAQPAGAAEVLLRERLLDAVDRHRPLLLLQAPAGFGKTVFLSRLHALIRNSGACAAWVSLDAADAEATAFVAAVALALVNAGVLENDDALVPSPNRSVLAAVDNIAARARDVQRETWLFLDNWQQAQSHGTVELLESLLRRLPANWHVALASRTPPRLSLAMYRASAQLSEIGAEDLRMSDEEVLELLAHRACPPDAVHAVTARTQGWPIAVSLAALELQRTGDFAALRSSFLETIDGMSDYLETEIFSRLEDRLKEFLIEISICDSFDAELADCVRGSDDAGCLIEALRPLNGLISFVPLRRDGRRLHPILAEFLGSRRRGLDRSRLRLLHKRAADWFESRTQLGDAVAHARESGDEARTIRLVESANCLDLCIRGGALAVNSLLENLPEEGIVITKHGQPIARVAPLHPTCKGERVVLPLLKGKGRPGPQCPNTETPYDLVFG